jgi:hypothetical protein
MSIHRTVSFHKEFPCNCTYNLLAQARWTISRSEAAKRAHDGIHNPVHREAFRLVAVLFGNNT